MRSLEILAVDIGNTSVTFGHFSKGRLIKTARMYTSGVYILAAAVGGAETLLRRFPLGKIHEAVIASVVPQASRRFLGICRRLGLKASLIGRDLTVPIKNKARYPRQVGVDRLVNALYAFHKYHRPAVVVDFGTAITFDVVSAKGEYLGGVIAPGIEISLEALYQETALLPRIRLAKPKRVIGRDTVESIRSGCAYGLGGLCDRILEEIVTSLHSKPLVIATGGYARFMKNYCRRFKRVDPVLTLKGIYLTRLQTVD